MYRQQAICTPHGNTAVAQFDQEHGPDRVFHNNRIYFADGAWRENSQLPGMCPPSSDTIERHKAIMRYQGLLLKIETDDFDQLKYRLSQQNASVSEEALSQLKSLQKLVLDRREKLGHMREELDELVLAPHLQAFNQRVSKLEDELEDAEDALKDAEAASREADEIEILEQRVKSIGFSIGIHCKNLHRLGGKPPKHLMPFLQEALNRDQANESAEAQRLAELRSLEV